MQTMDKKHPQPQPTPRRRFRVLWIILALLFIGGVGLFGWRRLEREEFSCVRSVNDTADGTLILRPNYGNPETVTIDFGICSCIDQTAYVPMGSTSIRVRGQKASSCELWFDTEIEMPAKRSSYTKCSVPMSLGVMSFPVKNLGVNFGEIEKFCR